MSLLRNHWQSWSIFSRTLLLLVGSLLLVQLISIVLIITLPPPRPFFVGMSELSAVLAGTPAPPSNRHRLDPDAMDVTEAPSPPVAEPGMVEVHALTGVGDAHRAAVVATPVVFPAGSWLVAAVPSARYGCGHASTR